MQLLFVDILNLVNNTPEAFEKFSKDNGVRILMQHAFHPDHKLNLPAGTPKFKPDRAPISMSPTNLRFESKRLYVYSKENVTQERKEELFVQLLESLHPSEAEIAILIKDQALHKIYPKLTHEWAASVGIRPVLTKEEQKSPEPEPIKEDVADVEPTPEPVDAEVQVDATEKKPVKRVKPK